MHLGFCTGLGARHSFVSLKENFLYSYNSMAGMPNNPSTEVIEQFVVLMA